MAFFAAQPADKGAHQKLGVEPIGLGAPVFTRHRNGGGVDGVASMAYPRRQRANQKPSPAAS